MNYYFKFSGIENKFNEGHLLEFLSFLSMSISINTVYIHSNYQSYYKIVENILNNNLSDEFNTIDNIIDFIGVVCLDKGISFFNTIKYTYYDRVTVQIA